MSATPMPSKPVRGTARLSWFWILFILGLVLGGIIFLAKRPAPQQSASVPVLNHAVPAYYFITEKDIAVTTVAASRVVSDTAREPSDLMGSYTLTEVVANEPVRKSQTFAVSDTRLISDTLAVGISASNATILGGSLRAGDIVRVGTVPVLGTTEVAVSTFNAADNEVLVLDVKPGGKDVTVIVAIPASRWTDYMAALANAQLVLARKVN